VIVVMVTQRVPTIRVKTVSRAALVLGLSTALTVLSTEHWWVNKT